MIFLKEFLSDCRNTRVAQSTIIIICISLSITLVFNDKNRARAHKTTKWTKENSQIREVEFQPIENGGTYLWLMAEASLITRPLDYHSYNSGARSLELML